MKIAADLALLRPIDDYFQAVQQLEDWLKQEPQTVNPQAGMRWFTQGQKSTQSIVLFHGYTNCPRQFYKLGEEFYLRGYNVLIPRFPGHAMHDRLTTAISKVTTNELIGTANRAINLAHGLGEQVWVMGLSMGGVLATWAAFNRPDIHGAVIISPAIGVQVIPARVTPLVSRLLMQLPNVYRWWDPNTKDAPIPPLHAYPRYATRSLSQVINLGQVLLAEAGKTPPQVSQVIVVINPTDDAIDVAAVEGLVENWHSSGAVNVKTYIFDPKYQLKHDIIDPDQPDQQVEIVYPVLLALLPDG